MASTGFPQRRPIALLLMVLGACLAPLGATRAAQSPATEPAAAIDPGPVFHVFLADGRALASYGECAVLGDRVVFTLVIGDGGLSTQYQLMSLPASAVDLERTTRYRDAVRSARYASTRGETDFADITAEVSRALDQLTKIDDPKARVAAADDARRRLLDWSRDNYHYRAADIQALAGLFDDVIAELRVASGEARVSMDLIAGAPQVRVEPIRRSPTLRESIELALVAASVSDVSTDRFAVLRAAAAASAGSDDLSATVTRRLGEEQALNQAWAALRTDALTRAQAALVRGDEQTAAAVRADTAARGQSLGASRHEELLVLLRDLDELGERARAHRAALDRYALMRPQLLAYERAVRPVLSGLDGIAPVLKAIEAMNGPEFSRLERVSGRLVRLEPQLAALVPPDDLTDVHATFVSALHLAREAFRRRRLAIAANDAALAREASAAAAGATMLVEQARQNLVSRLYPPQAR